MTWVIRIAPVVCVLSLSPLAALADEAGLPFSGTLSGASVPSSTAVAQPAVLTAAPVGSATGTAVPEMPADMMAASATSVAEPAVPTAAPVGSATGTAVPEMQAIMTAAEVVVTASRSRQLLREVPDSISVTGPEDVRDNNARDLGGVVGRAPGVGVFPYGGPGSGANLAVRGSRANQVLVMQDGRPINQASSGEADASQVPAGVADRVEILRGPSSLLYGSSAIGGVVNVMTPEPPGKFSGAVEGQGGTFGTTVRRVRVGGPAGPSRLLFLHEGMESGGARPNSEYRGESFTLKGELVRRPLVTVTGGASDNSIGVPGVRPSALPHDATDINPISWGPNPARRSAGDEEFGNAGVASLIDRQANSNRYVDTQVEAGAGDLSILTLHHYTEFNALSHHFGSYAGFGAPEIKDSVIDSDIQGAEAQFTVRPWLMEGGHVTVGGEWRKERLVARETTLDTVTGESTDKVGIRARVETGAEFVEGSVKPLAPLSAMAGRPWFDGLTVAAGARHDRHSAFGSVLNPHVGASFDATPLVPAIDLLVARVSYGTVFRSPSLNDLFWPDSLYSGGNPALRPERGHAAEGGIECRTGGVTARAGAFTRDVRDQIDWAPDSAGKWQPRNVGLVTTRGFEGELSWRWRWVRLGGNLTAVDARQRQAEVLEYDPVTWAPLATAERERFAAHVPSWTAGASAGVDLPTRTGLSFVLRGAGPRRMYIEDTFETFPKTRTVTKRLGSFAVLTARVSQALTDALEVYAGAENLADRKYSSRFGNTVGDGDYPAPPRTWYAGATARW